MAGIASSSSSSSEDLTAQAAAPQVEPIDALLQRRQCELMYELKRLQHGDRPVTGQESRDKVGSFLSKRLERQTDTNNPVANEDNVEEHRPQQITVEVQGLMQRRTVSSVLQSASFRRSLERVVRGHISAPPTYQRTRARATDSPAASVRSSQESPAPSSRATASPMSVAESSTGSSLVQAPAAARAATPVPPAPILDAQSISNIAERLGTPPPQPVVLPEPAQVEENVSAEDRWRRWNHEEFVMEISELVHRQLVSSTLQGRFRDRLEHMVLDRVTQSGANGLAVQEEIQRLPRSNIRHNDFSHLGIPAIDQLDLDDAVSVISATASASIPYAQTNAAVQREMNSLKAQVSQLTDMLKKSLELQIDIQRSIKQEVTAAMNQHAVQSAVAAAAPNVRSQRATDSKCIICLDGDSDAVLYRCGHICLCFSCATRMKSQSGACPVCRAPIVDVVRAYRISNE